MKSYNVPEFRQNLREAFNHAENGEKVQIERHGVEFILVATKHSPFVPDFGDNREGFIAVHTPEHKITLVQAEETDEQSAIKSEKNNSLAKAKNTAAVAEAHRATEELTSKLREDRPDLKFCKMGHILAGSGKCLQKGCKYA